MASIRTRMNKDGSVAYVVRVYAGRDADGKPRSFSKSYTPAPGTGKQKIEQTLKKTCAELESRATGPAAMQPTLTFRDLADVFLSRKSFCCSPYTMQSYRLTLRKACEYIGDLPLDRIRAQQLDAMTSAMAQAASQYRRPYSSSYIRHVHTLVRGCLGMAVREGLLDHNPADRAHYTPLRAEPCDPVFLEQAEAQAYVRAAVTEPDLRIRAMVLLFLFTGIRMEELCGLEWGDIDFSEQTICIRRASVYVPGQGVITKAPKTRAGARTLRADALVFSALQAYLQSRQAEPDSRLFTRRDGGPLIPGETAVWLHRFAQKHGLRAVSPHKLRHTYATLQIAYGTDIRTVAGAMGHSSPATTLNIYSHQVQEASEKASRAMSAMLVP